MKRCTTLRILSAVMCLITVAGLLSSCRNEESDPIGSDITMSAVQSKLKWIIPTVDAQSIEPFVRADYNDKTKHYDISYADCFKIVKSGKYGIIDYNGKIVIEPQFDSIVAIRNSRDFLGVKKDKNGEINQTYINYKDFSTETAYKSYNTVRYEYLWNTEEGNVEFIQKDGDEIYEEEVKSVLPESVRGVKTVDGELVSDGTYGLYINGKNVMGMIYSGAGVFANGAAAFKSNGVWGYIDSNGKTVIPFGCDAVKGYSAFGGEDTPYECYDGYVTVTKNGKFGIMTNEGKAITDFVYDGATPVVRGRIYLLQGNKWGLASLGDSEDAAARTDATTAVTKITTEKSTETTTEKTTEATTAETTTFAEETGTYIVNTDGLNFRADIGTESESLALLDEGTKLEIDKISDGWGHTYVDGVEGWVRLDYLNKE